MTISSFVLFIFLFVFLFFIFGFVGRFFIYFIRSFFLKYRRNWLTRYYFESNYRRAAKFYKRRGMLPPA